MKYIQVIDSIFYADLTGSAPKEWLFEIPDIELIETPDYVFPGWGYDPTKEGDERFIKPTPPKGWLYDDATGTFYEKNSTKPSERNVPVFYDELALAYKEGVESIG